MPNASVGSFDYMDWPLVAPLPLSWMRRACAGLRGMHGCAYTQCCCLPLVRKHILPFDDRLVCGVNCLTDVCWQGLAAPLPSCMLCSPDDARVCRWLHVPGQAWIWRVAQCGKVRGNEEEKVKGSPRALVATMRLMGSRD